MIKAQFCQNRLSTSTPPHFSTKSKTEFETSPVFRSQLAILLKPPFLSSSPTASGTSPLCPSNQGTSVFYRRFKIPEVDALTSAPAPAKQEKKEEKKEDKKDAKK